MPRTSTSGDCYVTVRLTATEHEVIKGYAEEARRTTSNMAAVLIQEAVAVRQAPEVPTVRRHRKTLMP